MVENQYDVIIAGSGPAGSTASTLLAQRGHRVLMIDRDQHPRFHIGESLLPMGEPVLKRLGIKWPENEFLPKNGAEFIDEKTAKKIRFPLASEYQPHQVERAKFDLMMLENAQSKGVEVHQGEAIKGIEIAETVVSVSTSNSKYKARYLIDASGRSAIMGRRLKSIKRLNNLGRFALYAHYKNAKSVSAKALQASGDIKVLIVDIGWIWIIPLVNNRLSIGLVVKHSAETNDKTDALFARYIKASPILTDLLNKAEQENPVHAEAEFSYSNKTRFGERFACCGDASGFLDPVFSSGVFMAITSAERVADTLSLALTQDREADPLLQAKNDSEYLTGFNSMLLFVERFYNHDLVGRLLFESQRNHDVKANIMGLLAGDLWSGDNQFQNNLLLSRMSQNLVV